MKTRHIVLLILSAAALAVWLPERAHAQGLAPPQPSGVLGIIQHGNWQCTLPGDAGGAAYIDVPEENFRIGTASSYVNAAGNGIYLMRGDQITFTRGPKKGERFKRLGDNTLQKLNPDGSLTKLICTRLGGPR
jgi:hypothetical protein